MPDANNFTFSIKESFINYKTNINLPSPEASIKFVSFMKRHRRGFEKLKTFVIFNSIDYKPAVGGERRSRDLSLITVY